MMISQLDQTSTSLPLFSLSMFSPNFGAKHDFSHVTHV